MYSYNCPAFFFFLLRVWDVTSSEEETEYAIRRAPCRSSTVRRSLVSMKSWRLSLTKESKRFVTIFPVLLWFYRDNLKSNQGTADSCVES